MPKSDHEPITFFRLTEENVSLYESFLFRSFHEYLRHCGQKNIVAVGAKDADGEPVGLALALTRFTPEGGLSSEWMLCSIFVAFEQRRRGIGRGLWEWLRTELAEASCTTLHLQGVLREKTAEDMTGFLTAMGFSGPKRIAKIYGFSTESIRKSVFVKGATAESFKPDASFLFRSVSELTEANLAEIQANEGEWYPPFVNPLIGKEQYNDKCTLFAVDPATEKIAGWITVLNVNNETRLLYRTFFTRESYRNTPVGFHLFTEAIKNNLRYYPERCGLSSIPTGNEKAMRFSELFFRDAVEYISYEIAADYCFLRENGA